MAIDDGLVDDFVLRSSELLERLEACTAALGSMPANEQLLASMSLDFHTLKGTAGFFAAPGGVSELCHLGEALILSAEQRQLRLAPSDIELLHDLIAVLARQLAVGKESQRCEQLSSTVKRALLERAPSHLIGVRPSISERPSIRALPATTGRQANPTRSCAGSGLVHRLEQYSLELGERLDKGVHVEICGDFKALDPMSAAVLSELLVHLLNNAVDHGLESRNERAAMGKDRCGKVRVSLAIEPARLHCRVSDDGRGIEPEALTRSGCELQSFKDTPTTGAATTRNFNLICRRGASSKRNVTSISGRGLGMAAVVAQLEYLGGELQIESESRAGTTFSFNIPCDRLWLDSPMLRGAQGTA